MPKIPVYGEPQQALGGRPRQGLSGQEIQQIGYWGGGQMAQSGKEMMSASSEWMNMELQRQRDDAKIEFEQKRAAFEVALAEGDEGLRKTDTTNISRYSNPNYVGGAEGDKETYFNKSVANFKKLAASEAYQSNNQFTRQMWAQWTAAKEADVKIAAIKFEASQRIQARENSLDEAITNDSRLAVANPEKIPELIDKWKNLLGGFGKDKDGKPIEGYVGVVRPAFLRDRMDKLGALLAIPALEKMIVDNPKAARELLKSMGDELKLGQGNGGAALPNMPTATIDGKTLDSVNAEINNEIALAESWKGKPTKELNSLLDAQKKRITVLETTKEALTKEQKRLDEEYAKRTADFNASRGESSDLLGDAEAQKKSKNSLMARWGLEGSDWARLSLKARQNVEAVSAYEKFKLEVQIQDHIAATSSGGLGNPAFATKEKLTNAVAQVFGEPDTETKGGKKLNDQAMIFIDKAWSDIRVGQRAWSIASGLRYASMEEINKTLKNLQPTGAGAAETAQIRDRVTSVVRGYLAERQSDLPGYVQQHPQVQQAIKENDMGKARDLMIALQLKLGSQTWEVGVLSKQQVADEVGRLRNADPNQVAGMIRNFEERFGGKNPDGTIKNPAQLQAAWRQLFAGPDGLNSSWQLAARSMGTNAESKIIAALRTPTKLLEDQLGTLTKNGQSYSDLKSTMLQEGEIYKRALTGNLPERMEMWQGALELATKVAGNDIYQNKTDTKTAARNALQTIMQSFDMTGGTYIIPKARPGYPTSYDNQRIHANADYLKSPEGLQRFFALVPPDSKDAGVNKSADYKMQQYIKTLQRDAYWVTNDDSSGLVLMMNTASGPQRVATKTGQVEASFTDLSKNKWRPAPDPTQWADPMSGLMFGAP